MDAARLTNGTNLIGIFQPTANGFRVDPAYLYAHTDDQRRDELPTQPPVSGRVRINGHGNATQGLKIDRIPAVNIAAAAVVEIEQLRGKAWRTFFADAPVHHGPPPYNGPFKPGPLTREELDAAEDHP